MGHTIRSCERYPSIDKLVQEPQPQKDHICGKVLDYCICGTTKILFCLYCKEVVGYQKENSHIRISVNIISGLVDESIKQDEYDSKTIEELR